MRWACSKIRISDFQFQSFNQHFSPFAIRFFLSSSVLRKHANTLEEKKLRTVTNLEKEQESPKESNPDQTNGQ